MSEHLDYDQTIRRALGLAIQILEDAPEWLRPKCDMDDMKTIMAGKTTGRDGYIITEAVATALFYRAQQAATHAVNTGTGLNNRLQEFLALFELMKRCDPWLLAIKFNEACDRNARAELDAP